MKSKDWKIPNLRRSGNCKFPEICSSKSTQIWKERRIGRGDLRANLNEGLIKFKDKSCFCSNNKDEATVRIFESVDNPRKLHFCCRKPRDDRERCKFSQFWLPGKDKCNLEVFNLISDLRETMVEVWQKLDSSERLVLEG